MEQAALKVGVKGEERLVVTERETAGALGSGDLSVFATPAMITLMEACAARSVHPYLPRGSSSVGARIDICHLAATPLGASVRCETELVEIDGRRLVFSCAVYDEAGLIGEGMQERCVVDNERFLAKAARRMASRE